MNFINIKSKVYVVLFLCVFVLTSCGVFIGSDGKDGEVFISIDWIEEPISYEDNNPDVPDFSIDLERGEFYQTEQGAYIFEYEYEDGFGWKGTYQIKAAEPGSGGSFYQNRGTDGKNAYYSLILSYGGIIFDNEYKNYSKYLSNGGSQSVQIYQNDWVLVINFNSFQKVINE